MGNAHVVDVGEGFLGEGVAHGGAEGVGVALAVGGEVVGEGEGAVEDAGGAALIAVEVAVAAGHGEGVALADGRDGDDVDGQGEVVDHAADDEELLGVLLAEVTAVGRQDVEELEHDGADAAKVAGAVLALKALADGAGLDPRAEAFGVHLGRGGDEEDVDTLSTEGGKVVLHWAGVGVEVTGVTELGGVHVDGSGDGLALGPGAAQESEVALVEGAHGEDGAEGALDAAEGVTGLGDGGADLHTR